MMDTHNHIAVFWDNKMMFHRLVEDACGYCEAVTPLMLTQGSQRTYRRLS